MAKPVSNPAMSAEEGVVEIARQLERISRLLAVIAIRAEEDEGARVALLASAGYTYAEIGRFVSKKPDAVRMILARSRARGNGRRG